MGQFKICLIRIQAKFELKFWFFFLNRIELELKSVQFEFMGRINGLNSWLDLIKFKFVI